MKLICTVSLFCIANLLFYISAQSVSTAERKPQKSNEIYYPAALPDESTGSEYEKFVKAGYIDGSALTDSIYRNGTKLNVWDMNSYNSFMQGSCPNEVHPQLWQMENLSNVSGIFQVYPFVEGNGGSDGKIYQARGFDLADMSFIKGETGWIVIDALENTEQSARALREFKKAINDENAVIHAIIVTHSHADHYRGVEGVVNRDDIWHITQQEYQAGAVKPEGKVLFLAPDGFFNESISENLYLGNSMARRADYMYGNTLPRDAHGHVGSGLGKTATYLGNGSLLKPSFEVVPEDGDVTTMKIDGLTFVFQNAPGTEAPAEFHIYIKEYKTLCPGENVTYTMHNLLTSRGAKVRSPKAFANAIDRAIELFPDVEILLGVHHWPTWGNDRCMNIMTKQRDMYYYFNDQVIRMLNKGMNMEEIAEVFTLPASLNNEFFNQGFYGSISHNVKAVVQHYVGWWDGNPANYFKYPDVEYAKRFVADMGGEDAIIKKAHEYFDKQDYRWVIELLRHVVFANPDNKEARNLQADAMEQLAYSFEAGTWRNIYLAAACELRGMHIGIGSKTAPEFVQRVTMNLKTLPAQYVFEYLSVLVKGDVAADVDEQWNVKIGDEIFNIHLVNGVLHRKMVSDATPDVVFANVSEFADDYNSGMMAVLNGTNDTSKGLNQLYQYLDVFDGAWNIIEPLKPFN